MKCLSSSYFSLPTMVSPSAVIGAAAGTEAVVVAVVPGIE